MPRFRTADKGGLATGKGIAQKVDLMGEGNAVRNDLENDTRKKVYRLYFYDYKSITACTFFTY